MIDPVDRDLNAHLAQIDRDDAISAAEEAKVEELMADPKEVQRIWDKDGLTPNGIDIASALLGHPDDRAARALRLLDILESMVREAFTEIAPDLVRADMDRAIFDEQEARSEAREDDRDGL